MVSKGKQKKHAVVEAPDASDKTGKISRKQFGRRRVQRFFRFPSAPLAQLSRQCRRSCSNYCTRPELHRVRVQAC